MNSALVIDSETQWAAAFRLYQQGKIGAACLVRGLYRVPHIVRAVNRLIPAR